VEQLNIVPFNPAEHNSYIAPLTELLHLSYEPLARAGMRYLATHQPPETTFKRLCEGDSFLSFSEGRLIGTITLKPTLSGGTCAWYKTTGVYHFGQFAIHPDFQKLGIGSRMMDMVEERARTLGARELALDTSEHAHHLISMYQKRNYRFIEYAQWDVTNYRSVILSKSLEYAL
jgi:GNAT superfamily N-acetyltransferase